MLVSMLHTRPHGAIYENTTIFKTVKQVSQHKLQTGNAIKSNDKTSVVTYFTKCAYNLSLHNIRYAFIYLLVRSTLQFIYVNSIKMH